jgi:NADH:ubiquinone oxidoreductase subunit 3 (subunit A)
MKYEPLEIILIGVLVALGIFGAMVILVKLLGTHDEHRKR